MSIALVQQKFSYTASGGSSSKVITLDSAPTAGSTLVLMIKNDAGQTVTSVSGGGVTWARHTTLTSSVPTKTEIWLGPNSSGSGTAITVVVSNTYQRYSASVSEWSGMPTTTTADGGSAADSANPSPTTPSVSPTGGTPVLLLAVAVGVSGRSLTAGPTGGFTALDVTGGPPTADRSLAYQIVASASGSYQAGWTNSAGYGNTMAGLYAFTGDTGGGGGGGQPAVKRMGGVAYAHGGYQPNSGRMVW